ncbi:MAG TPA: sigma 54-interacting transcriptional regulator [Thermoanaerobaculia bacterium]|nr:sigma 54-interacting transcriptional regulator [Thermoanaerobaculia bacterium]
MSADRFAYLLKVLEEGGAEVRHFYLEPGEHLVGSAPECQVLLAAAGVSRRHARLQVFTDGGALVADLGSKNGTFVHGRRIREAAVAEWSVLAFGPVQAVLQPAGAGRGQVLLGAAGPGAGEAAAHKNGRSAAVPEEQRDGLTTQGLHPLESLAASLPEVLGAVAAGLETPEGGADALAHRWLAILALGRAEFLRVDAGGREAVLAAASTAERVPRGGVGHEVAGPEGWRLRLRGERAVSWSRLDPLFELALAVLAGADGPGRPGRPGRVQQRPAPHPSAGAAAAESAPPPPGLGALLARLYRRAGKVARGDVPVLILGESGSGKDVLARWIHARSRRARGPLLAVNCAALPRDLLEAELFGIERGVATGVEARAGLLERANGGTVFLDEIGDMAPETQAKVLRVLEGTSLFRVGGKTAIPVDVRFLAATNRDLGSLVEEGAFRRDLYHRLAAFECRLPPLRERREEIPGLAARFFHREAAKAGLASPGITRAALSALVLHAWPGNVRELEHEIAAAVLLLEPGEPLDLPHLSPRLRRAVGEEGPTALTLEETVRRAERESFAVALAAAQGDAAQAMEILGLPRSTYYRKLKELGLNEE